MSANQPPRFIPTLTETVQDKQPQQPAIQPPAPSPIPPTPAIDIALDEVVDAIPYSMLDLELDDMEHEPPTKVPHVAPLSVYQQAHWGEDEEAIPTQADLPAAAAPKHPQPAATAANQASQRAATTAAPLPKRPAAAIQSPSAALSPAARPAAAPASAPHPHPAPATQQQPPAPTPPTDWQHQLQQAVRAAVRQELQQQLPFLLLQWSREIEDKLTPALHEHILKAIEQWPQHSK